MSLRDHILEVASPKVHEVDDPKFVEKYGKIFVRELTGIERMAVDTAISDNANYFREPEWRGRLASIYLCEENGDRIFTLEDATTLARLSFTFLDAVIAKGHFVSGIGDEVSKEAKGNSKADQD